MKNGDILKFILILFLGWRVALLLIAFFGISVFPSLDPVQNVLYWAAPDTDFFMKLANWDGGHYRAIASEGYIRDQAVFFPFYSVLIKLLMFLKIPTLWGGLLISHLSIVIALFYLFKLTALDFGEKVAKKAVLAILIFPTSFYLGTVYSESLFLALSIPAFYFVRTNRVFLAFLLAGFCGATRQVGAAVILGISAEYFFQNFTGFSLSQLWGTYLRKVTLCLLGAILFIKIVIDFLLRNRLMEPVGILSTVGDILFPIFLFFLVAVLVEFILRHLNFKKVFSWRIFYLFLALIPIALYLLYQHWVWGDALGFVSREAAWDRRPTLPWETAIAYFNYLLINNFFVVGQTARPLLEFFSFVLLVIGWIISLYKLRVSYNIFYLATVLFFLSSGTLVSVPRYALVIFPLFLILANIKNEKLVQIAFIFSAFLLAILSVMYINCYWVT